MPARPYLIGMVDTLGGDTGDPGCQYLLPFRSVEIDDSLEIGEISDAG